MDHDRGTTLICGAPRAAMHSAGPAALLLGRVEQPRHERAAGAQPHEAECRAPHLVTVVSKWLGLG